MEFFFPADVFASVPGQARSGPSNSFSNCGFSSQAPFQDFFADAIREERAAETARARARAAQQARAEAIQRARAARRAAEAEREKAAEEQQFRAYFEHVLGLHNRHEQQARQRQAQQERHAQQLQVQLEQQARQRQAKLENQARQRQVQLENQARQRQAQLEHQARQLQAQQELRAQLERQRQQEMEEARRQQYADYQRQKEFAIQQQRERVAAMQAARSQGKQFFMVLEDLLVDGLRAFFGDEEPTEAAADNSRATHSPADPAFTASQDLKGKSKAQDQAPEQQQQDITAASSAATPGNVAENDPEELGPVPTHEVVESGRAPVDAVKQEPIREAKTKKSVLVFEHDFPTTGSFDQASVDAGAIDISVDEEKRTVTVSGLWNNESSDSARAGSPTPSSSSGSQRGRSRSPKRARVADVDENGNEIVAPEMQQDNDDDFVEIQPRKNDSTPATVQRTFSLPTEATFNDLRAELTDQGLKLYSSKA